MLYPSTVHNQLETRLERSRNSLRRNSAAPPIASKSEQYDPRGNSQRVSSTTFVSSKFEQIMCSHPLPGIRDYQAT